MSSMCIDIVSLFSSYVCHCFGFFFFFFKQKTAYEMRISDWSSDVCSSDLIAQADHGGLVGDLLAVEPCAAALDQAPGFTLRGRKTEIGRASCRERVCQYV